MKIGITCYPTYGGSGVVATELGLELAARGDLTVCLNVITSTSPTKRAAIWDAVREITKPGGHALVVVPALESAQKVAALDERVSIVEARPDLVETDGSAQKYYTHEELEGVLARHGLEPVRIERVHYPWSEELDGRKRSRTWAPFDWAILARRPRSTN